MVRKCLDIYFCVGIGPILTPKEKVGEEGKDGRNTMKRDRVLRQRRLKDGGVFVSRGEGETFGF